MRKSTSQEAQSGHSKIFIYGATGSGKTTAISTLNPATTLVLSTEGQTPGRLKSTGKNFEIWTIEQWEDIDVMFSELWTEEICNKFKVIALDSLSNLNDLLHQFIVQRYRPSVKNQKGNVYNEIMDLQDYNVANSLMRTFLNNLVNLPFHIVATGREKSEKDDIKGLIRYTPELTGKLASAVASFFGEVYRLSSKTNNEGQFLNYFTTKGSELVTAKGDRRLEYYENDPDAGTVDLGKILFKINSNQED